MSRVLLLNYAKQTFYLNCDGLIDGRDIYPATLAIVDLASYNASYPGCNALNLDFDQDDLVRLSDIPLFVDALLGRPVGFNPGDANCDGLVDGRDLGAFNVALVSPAQYAMDYPDCLIANMDLSDNGVVDLADIPEFVMSLLDQ